MQPGDKIEPQNTQANPSTAAVPQLQPPVQLPAATQAASSPQPQPQATAPIPESVPAPAPQSPQAPFSVNPTPLPPVSAPLPNPEPVLPAAATPAQASASAWQYAPETQSPQVNLADSSTGLPPIEPVEWTASEYVTHEKNGSWLFLVLAGTIALAVFLYLRTDELVSSAAILTVGSVFAAFGFRKPRTLSYRVDAAGLHVGERFFAYTTMRSFSVLQEGGIRSLMFVPLQRFSLPLTVYYAPEDEDRILDVITEFLPHEDRQAPAVDRVMSKIRF